MPVGRVSGDFERLLSGTPSLISAFNLQRILAIAVGAGCLAAIPLRSVEFLTPGGPISGEASLEETTLFLDLEAGEFVRVSVEQREVDLVLELRAPDGGTLAQRDSPTGNFGEEELSVVVAESGRYRLVLLRSAGVKPGKFVARLLAKRPAQAQDRSWAEAEEDVYDSLLLSLTGDPVKLRKAVDGYRNAADLWGSLRQVGREEAALCQAARTSNKAGVQLRKRGQSSDALASFEGALVIYLRLHDHLTASDDPRECDLRRQADTLSNLGLVQSDLGRPYEAIERLQQARAIWEGLPLRKVPAVVFNNLGTLHRRIGNYGKACALYEKALKITVAQGRSREQARTLYNLARSHFFRDDFAKAEGYFRRSLVLSRELSDRNLEASILGGFGRLRIKELKWERAQNALNAALRVHRALGSLRGEALTLQSLGDLEGLQGRVDEAQAYSREALEIFRSLGDIQGEAAQLIRQARLAKQRNQIPVALELSALALELVDSLRHELVRPDFRAIFTASLREYHETHIDLLYLAHRADPGMEYDVEAFECAERVRARSFLETLVEAKVDLYADVDPRLVKREAGLRDGLNAAELHRMRLLEANAPAEDLETLNTSISRKIEDLRHLQVEIERSSPLFDRLVKPEAQRLRDIQGRELDGRDLLLEFMLGEKRSFLWAVSDDSFEFFELPPRAKIAEVAERFEVAVTARSRGLMGAERAEADRHAQRAALSLSEILLAPIAAELTRHRRLIIVPDGILQSVPFAALPLPGSEKMPEAAGAWFDSPLIDLHEVSVQPSASVLALLRAQWARRAPPPKSMALWGDPVFRQTDRRLGGNLGPFRERLDGEESFDAEGKIGRTRFWLDRLFYSADEVRTIAALRPDARVFLDFEAALPSLRGAGLYGHLHFATHGVVNTDWPELSGLAFSHFDRRGKPRDGFLWLKDIYRMDLNADLVVLSACGTAAGKEILGEGRLSLARSFLHAGARRVVASQWNVDDRATAELMKLFYRALEDGAGTPAAALREAQRSMAKQPAWRAPYFWAGFLLHGEWR